MKRRIVVLALALTAMMSIKTASAQVGDFIPVGGMLADLDGVPIDKAVDVTFVIYDSSVATTPLWEERRSGAEQLIVDQGMFSTYLGEIEPLNTLDLIQADELWLGITIGTDSEIDRILMGSAPAALQARFCHQVIGVECEEGQYLRGWNDETGDPICATDETDGGSATGLAAVHAGSGLQSDDDATSPTLSVDFSAVATEDHNHPGMVTEEWVASQSYATQDWVTGQNLASQDWVAGQSYATETWIGAQGYMTESWVNSQGFASEGWVGEQNYATQSWLTSQNYATQAWVGSQSYATQALVNDLISVACEEGQYLRGWDQETGDPICATDEAVISVACEEGQYLRGWDQETGDPICATDETDGSSATGLAAVYAGSGLQSDYDATSPTLSIDFSAVAAEEHNHPGMASEEWVASQSYATQDWINGQNLASEEWVAGQDYATQGWVAGQNLASQEWVAGQSYATEAWIGSQGYTTESWVNSQGYATEVWVGAQNHATEEWVGSQSYATQTWVNNQNYTTQDWVNGQSYATESWVSGQDYATETWVSNQDYATESWVDNQSYATQTWVNSALGSYQPDIEGVTCSYGISSISNSGGVTCAFESDTLPFSSITGTASVDQIPECGNADTLDGSEASDFESAGSVAAHEADNVHLFAIQYDELTGGGETTLHSHPSGSEAIDTDVITSVFEKTYSSTDTPYSMGDVELYVSTINVADSGSLRDINVAVGFTHADLFEVEITLLSPSGTQVVLHQNEAGSNLNATYPTESTPSFGSMNDFSDENIEGNWELRVFDPNIGDSGELNQWILEIEYLSDNVGHVAGDLQVAGNLSVAGMLTQGGLGFLRFIAGDFSSETVSGTVNDSGYNQNDYNNEEIPFANKDILIPSWVKSIVVYSSVRHYGYGRFRIPITTIRIRMGQDINNLEEKSSLKLYGGPDMVSSGSGNWNTASPSASTIIYADNNSTDFSSGNVHVVITAQTNDQDHDTHYSNTTAICDNIIILGQ